MAQGTPDTQEQDSMAKAYVISCNALQQAECLLQETLAAVQAAQRELFHNRTAPPTAKFQAVAVLAPLSHRSLARVRHLIDSLNGTEGLVHCSTVAAACGTSHIQMWRIINRLTTSGLVEKTCRGRAGMYLRVSNPFMLEALELVERMPASWRRPSARRVEGIPATIKPLAG